MIRRKAAKWAVVAAQRKGDAFTAIELPDEESAEYGVEDCAVAVLHLHIGELWELSGLTKIKESRKRHMNIM